MTRFSTNALTGRFCALRGWPCETVQRFYGGRRHDVFGFVDSIVLHPDEGMIFVQNCSYGTRDEHARKIDQSPLVHDVRRSVPIELWEWKRKKVGRKFHWFLRTQALGDPLWEDESPWEGPLSL
jgi:hypothetical protein